MREGKGLPGTFVPSHDWRVRCDGLPQHKIETRGREEDATLFCRNESDLESRLLLD
jgi:hypothetical protein